MTKPRLTMDDCMAPSPYTIAETATVAAACELMTSHQIRHLPVMDGDKLVGLLSMRDVSVVKGLDTPSAGDVLVRDVMSSDPYAVQNATDLREVALNMNAHKYGSAVVLDGDKVVGVFTTVDAMRVLANLL